MAGGPDGMGRLRVRVLLKNIGAGKVAILKGGTAVEVSRIADEQREAPATIMWDNFDKAYDIFTKDVLGETKLAHQLIEPAETIVDEVLLQLPIPPQIIQVRVQILLKRLISRNITVEARRIFTPSGDSVGSGKASLPTTSAKTGVSEA